MPWASLGRRADGSPESGVTQGINGLFGKSPALVVQGVSAGYGMRTVLEAVSFSVGGGELVALVGPNGAGKSTLLQVLAGLLEARTGEVKVLGNAPGREPRRVAYLPQADAVDWSFPLGALDVVLMGRAPHIGWIRTPRHTDYAIALESLRRVGMADLARRQIGALSGGQRRRVFLARALAGEPDLYLLDEPVAGVDAATEEDLMMLLRSECHSGKAAIVSTHDLASTVSHFQRVILLNRTMIADGPTKLLRDAEVLRTTYGGHLVDLLRITYGGHLIEVQEDAALVADAPRHTAARLAEEAHLRA